MKIEVTSDANVTFFVASDSDKHGVLLIFMNASQGIENALKSLYLLSGTRKNTRLLLYRSFTEVASMIGDVELIVPSV